MLVELSNSKDFDNYKNNLKLLIVLVENSEQYNVVSSTIKTLSDHNPNILFLVVRRDICKDLEIIKTSKPLTFVASVNGTEVKRCEATDSKSIEDLITFLNNHAMF
ncbi:hypothetical protein DICPUDRAFT_93266 [Dictyostelium purpureum]|uniref:Thioredoxin domain-containing protein n=1 Tax=Dictyostelium purpureum TaxID=5786 RepID=F1A4U9_DICPU|nr:uncharacterized protein DICPUDRAFT_93266 [Dictyostelium purpureum]EGC28779.1 hypothetical protein DICPUDRAFT_93266 [Dictyostelium purpureum]|eukprot:XP_003294693.1 hypothetical protein DICPUDRAFT_93266 [Dictyostelium purpureum]